MGSTLWLAIVVAGISYILYRQSNSKRYPAPLPPGPKGLPLIGNVLDLPMKDGWETFAKWGDIYGGISYATAFSKSLVILNDAKYAIDMMDKKGLLYSDRPTLVMGGELIGWVEGPALTMYCDRWSEYRKLFSAFMGSKSKVEGFSDTLQSETNTYLKHILENPKDWVEYTKRLAGQIVLMLAYGTKPTDPGGEHLVKLVDDAMDGFSQATKTNAFLVDVFPILQYVPGWVPGTGWQVEARMYHDYLEQMLRMPFDLVKKNMAAGTARASFTQSHLDQKTLTPEKERTIQWAAAGIYSGGADTTVAAIELFVMAAVLHQDHLKKAQAEIDAVLGPDHFPTMADRDRFPYFEAFFQEVHRMYCLAPLGLAHVAREDDIHDGYFIPKGSIIIPNNWKFYRDPRTYPDPLTFNPDRFMGENKQFDPRKYLYGYGRRICPGLHLADASVWLACINLVAAFDISPPVKDGKPVLPAIQYVDGGISHPEPFETVIKPRSPAAQAHIRAL